jgi:hypothetical protein
VVALAFSGAGAHADPSPNYGPHQWCPGQSMEWPTGPWGQVTWDMTVCHTWYAVGYGQGNVPSNYGGVSHIYEGDNPPPNDFVRPCPPISFMCP